MRRVAILVLPSILMVGAACSATPVSPEDFASEASSAATAYVEESQELSQSYQRVLEIKVANVIANEGDDAVEEVTDLVRDETVSFLSLLTDAHDRYTRAFLEIDAPTDVVEVRDDYVAALTRANDALPELRDDVIAAASIEDLRSALVASTYADAQLGLVATCTSLEQAMRDIGHGLDLKCVPTEIAPNGVSP